MPDKLETDQAFRVLTIVDQCTSKCQILEPGISLTGNRIAACLNEISKHKVNHIYFDTKINNIELEHNNVALYDKLLTIINGDSFLTKLLENQ